jgi:two-component system cell cycle response regulator DivK
MARILIIEDNVLNLRLASFLLQQAGYTVLSAESAEDGLQQVKESPPDLVRMDIQLPGIDGLEATRRLKADPATRGIKVIALTAFAMKGDEQKMREAGCDDYLA